MRPHARPARALLAGLTAVAGLLAAVPGSAHAAPAPTHHPSVTSREVVFDVVNTTDSALTPCAADNRAHRVHATLVGPTRDVRGYGGVTTINVLVHDAGTGGWFWHLPGDARYDYAGQLARQGVTSLVVERLGYDRSPLANGDRTCLGAQVQMLHQVVQHLYAGNYRPATADGTGPMLPHASHVVVQGHGTGATIAQLETSTFRDTDGLVLMSPARATASRLALSVARGQSGVCLSGRTYAPFGSTATYRRLLFATAPASVQRAAVRLRNQTPCGDVATLATSLLSATAGAGDVHVPVLQLRGSRDAGAAGSTSARYGSGATVTTRTVSGAGSALPLERSAPTTRRIVLRWLRGL